MKKLLIIFLILQGLFSFSQSPSVTSFLINQNFINKGFDKNHQPKYQADSVCVAGLISFDQPITEIQEVYFKLGSSQDSDDALNKLITVTQQGNKTYINYDGNTYPIGYGKSILFSFILKKNENMEWCTVSFKNKDNITSSKSYKKIDK